ncbi:hypothetical protein [Brassicibacter mesophilus]|uniref:hypothetical protein n=1 Tax=Brassicibacter mesophilus TaxID=745119 RepID=UPI003D1F1D81
MEIRDIMEILFNIGYLIVIWTLVVKMYNHIKRGTIENIKLAKVFGWAFALLALGDTGHVGFRVIAYLNGGIEQNIGLVGIGKLATSVTVTIFYVLLVVAWKLRYNKNYGAITNILFISALVRLIVLAFPANQWGSSVQQFNWVMYRNIPLMIIGLGITLLILIDAVKSKDAVFKWIGIMIVVSYGFYTPVILFAHKVPLIGLFMIPKTMAYLVAAFVVYYGVFRTSGILQLNN